MSGSRKTIDSRGLACPQPVILTKKAVEEGGFGELEVLVDNEAAKENVLRFASYAGLDAEATAGEGETRKIFIKPRGASASAPPGISAATGPTPSSGTGAGAADRDSPLTVFIPADAVGRGSDELGRLLMRGFTYALTEAAELPARVILMNAGVKLAAEGSGSLENLRKLAGFGVEVIACGTCLEFFGLKDKLAVGRVSNMYEIAELLQAGRTLTV